MGQIQKKRLINAIVMLSAILLLLVCSSNFLTYIFFNGQLERQLTATNMELLKQQEHKLNLALQNIDKQAIQLLRHDDIIRFFEYDLSEQAMRNNRYRITNMITNVINSNDYIFSIDFYSYVQNRLVSGNILTEQDLQQDFMWINQFRHYDGYANWMPTRKIQLTRSNYPIFRNVITLVRTYPLIHSPDGRKGAAAVNVKEDVLFDLIRNSSGDDVGETFVVDREGIVILHQDKNKLGKDISEFPYISTLMEAPDGEGMFTSRVEETNSSVFYVNSNYSGWTILRVVPDVQMTRPLEGFRNGLILLALVLFVAAAVSAAVIGRWTYKPVNRFIQSMSQHLKATSSKKTYRDEFQYFESTVQEILLDREQLQKDVHESRPYIKWKLMTDLISGNRNNLAQLQSLMNRIGVSLHSGQYIVMSVEFDNREDIPSPRDLTLYCYALCNVAEELINAENLGLAAETGSGKAVILMSFEESEDEQRVMMRAVSVADLLKDFVQQYFGRTVTIGIGEVVRELKKLNQSYKSSAEAIRYKLVTGSNTIITADDISSEPSPKLYRLAAMTDHILAAVHLQDNEKMHLQVRRWFEMLAEQSVPPELIVQLVVQCMMKAATAAAEIGVDPGHLFPEQSLYEKLNQYERLEQLEHYTADTMNSIIELIRQKRSGRERSEVIDKVLLYLQQYYMRNDLSLNLLASEFGISVSHLSKLFKEQTECNFIDYLMELRMNKAKELLSGSEEKIRSIADMVGYSNVNSFVRIFKKITGLTPTEYRARNNY
ncbi:helix-turn-helix domain-containing protein [Paenibacillus lemnae]|uniref:AraC family transcriptional regulator n=1 Tax=Paenibacillus lemnae TaxID=1330551 RepID=A0A848M797_PAELE|nr:helix-turn-helix domain-containing protein [Paenibacillus lemnae]NMO95444.1 AraC family transcriptional regulator [Paenibacillus lemnae]